MPVVSTRTNVGFGRPQTALRIGAWGVSSALGRLPGSRASQARDRALKASARPVASQRSWLRPVASRQETCLPLLVPICEVRLTHAGEALKVVLDEVAIQRDQAPPEKRFGLRGVIRRS